MDAPIRYEIRIEGQLSASWASWFEGLEFRHDDDETILSGTLVDQSALHGVLMRIRDLGLPLIAVNRVDTTEQNEPDTGIKEEGHA
jgi:hypothetical protein